MKTKKLLTAVIVFLAFTVTTLAQTIPSYVPANGLVGYWGFNGNANDLSGNGNNGIVNGASLTTDRNGNANSAYSFDGISNYIESTCTNLPLGNSSRSISAWVSMPSVNNNYTNFITSWGYGDASPTSANKAFGFLTPLNSMSVWQSFGSSQNNELFNTSFLPNNYYHVVVTVDNDGFFKFYINSLLVYSNQIIGMNTISNGGVLRIGRSTHTNTDAWAGYFLGKIDDLAIYNRVLTQTEITQLYATASSNVQTLYIKTIKPYNINVGDANHLGSTYAWSISPANANAVITGNGTNAITIDWTNVPDGTYTLQALVTSIEGCVSTAVNASIILISTVTITPPEAPVTQTFCTASTVANLTATGTNLKWYEVATAGVSLASSTILVTGTYYVSQTTGTNESTRTAVAVTIIPTTAPTASASQTFCASPTPTVASLIATGTAIKWYAAAMGGAPLASTTALVTGTTYYASQTVGTCESTRTAVADSINDPQITASATTVCAGTVVNLTASSTSQGMSVLPSNLQTGLMAFYPFNGNTNDSSINGNNPNINTIQYTTDRNGNANSAGLFLGQQYAIVPNSSSLNVSADFSVASWVYLNNDFPWTGWWNTKAIFTKDNDYPYGAKVFIMPEEDSLWISFGTNMWDANQGFGKKILRSELLGAWHHFTWTYDNNVGKLFLDGTLILSQSATPNWSTANTLDLHIAVNGDPAGNYPYKFVGKMDDLGLWSRSLSSSEITELSRVHSYLWSNGETTAAINPTPTTTTTYWCDVTTNGVTCRKEITITVTPKATPTFTPVAAICSGASLSALPTTSNNGINGVWSPALNNTATKTYTFTPNSGQCATSTTMVITVNSNVTPTFTPVAAICSGANLSALPTTSNNGISGVWSPVLNNTATKTYTFTPNAGQCASSTTMVIEVNSNVTPTFNSVASICSGASLSALPTTSNNGINGVWSPALNNSATTTYTFTPNAGQCATSTTMVITVTSNVTPTFTPVAAICSGASLAPLPTTSNNGINGVWSPALNNTATRTYTFTPNAGQCASSTTMVITVNSNVTPTFNGVAPVCSSTTLSPLMLTSNEGIKGSWAPTFNNLVTTTYTFIPTPITGQCFNTNTITIEINTATIPTGNSNQNFVPGNTIANIAVNPTNVVWYPTYVNALNNTYPLSPATLLVNGSTYYAVNVVGDCRSDVFSVTVNTTLGVNENFAKEFAVYPNPAKNILTLQHPSNIILYKIVVTDLTGKVIKTQTQNTKEINVADLASGVYIIEAYSGNKKFQSKFVKE